MSPVELSQRKRCLCRSGHGLVRGQIALAESSMVVHVLLSSTTLSTLIVSSPLRIICPLRAAHCPQCQAVCCISSDRVLPCCCRRTSSCSAALARGHLGRCRWLPAPSLAGWLSSGSRCACGSCMAVVLCRGLLTCCIWAAHRHPAAHQHRTVWLTAAHATGPPWCAA